MAHLLEFSQLMTKYCNGYDKQSNPIVDFYIIYIREAHGSDKYALEGNYDIKDATNINERIEGLKILIDQFKQLAPKVNIISKYTHFLSKQNSNDNSLDVTFLIDNMNNDLCRTFEAFTDRLYILHKNKIVFKGGIGPMNYDVKAVDVALSTMIN